MPGEHKQEIHLNLPDSDIRYYPDFMDAEEAHLVFRALSATVPWQQDPIQLFGKTYLQPRLTAL